MPDEPSASQPSSSEPSSSREAPVSAEPAPGISGASDIPAPVLEAPDESLAAEFGAAAREPAGTASTGADSAAAEPTTIEKLRGLPWSIASNAANTVFVQYTFFGSVFVLFLSELGLSKSEMGLMLSLLPFFGLIALFVAPAVERFGYKRTYLTFFSVRSVVTAGLLLTPVVLANFGAQSTLLFVAGVTALFSMLRAVGVTASFPWIQQYVPNNVRGKYTATNNIFTTATGFVAVTIAGVVLNRMTGLSGFMLLLTVGVLFGFVSVGFATLIPGGAPRPPARRGERQPRDLRTALGDGQFVSYLLGVGLLTLVTVPLTSFLPLFMRENVGLADSAVVWLQMGTLAGILFSSYLWGWAADRYGSIPVTLYGLGLRALLPLFWMLMPRDSSLSLGVALGIALLQGIADMGWGIGSARLLFVSIVPVQKRSDYMALYYAWIGVVGGISQLGGGRILDLSEAISGRVWVFTLDPFTPLFVAGLVTPLLSFVLLRRVREERGVGVGQFAGIFLRGNPFLAMSSMLRFHLARDEQSTVRMTAQLGKARSHLTVEELLEALEDPRFNVRLEAILTIARMPSDPRLVDALVRILEGSELALTVVAAWALGRLGTPNAVAPLRRALDSDYRSVRAYSARALGTLDAREVTSLLMGRLESETDRGLQMAYASALGNLQAHHALPQLFALLDETENQGARWELALTIARIADTEQSFIAFLRQAQHDPGTAMAQAVEIVQRRYARNRFDVDIDLDVAATMDRCVANLTQGDLASGCRELGEILLHLASADKEAGSVGSDEERRRILLECARQLSAPGDRYMEYAILALTLLTDAP